MEEGWCENCEHDTTCPGIMNLCETIEHQQQELKKMIELLSINMKVSIKAMRIQAERIKELEVELLDVKNINESLLQYKKLTEQGYKPGVIWNGDTVVRMVDKLKVVEVELKEIKAWKPYCYVGKEKCIQSMPDMSCKMCHWREVEGE
jgi:hypothetical protein